MTHLHRNARRACTLALVLAAGTIMPLRADEGMWTFDNPPLKQLKERYGFEPDQTWLDHVRTSSVRFSDGGSGSFISTDGLVLTNHHVARGQLQKVSTSEKDYLKNGFIARNAAEEIPCPDLELNVLMSMENVTAKILGVIKPGLGVKEAMDARKAEMARLEKESLDKTGLRSDIVTLYQGGEYWIYRYKKHTDIRLVFAPEMQAAFYGGDPDNFTFPRYNLDMAMLRVYENGKPVKSPNFLKWNPRGAVDGELVFVSGHPGSTERLTTLAQLEFNRDHQFPEYFKIFNRLLGLLRGYSARGPEEARQAGDMIFGLENGLKAITGEYEGLKDKALVGKKAQDEASFRRLVASKPEWQKEFGSAWDEISKAMKLSLEKEKAMNNTRSGGYRMPGIAMTLLRYVTEVAKPDGQRLTEYHEAGLESVRFRFLSPAPFYPALEELMLADSLTKSLEELGPEDLFVKAALQGRTPGEMAKALISGTKLGDPAVRKSLLEGGVAAVAASQDPMLAYARRIDPILRDLRKLGEDKIESVVTLAGENIGKARFAAYGKTVNPDANFTLRLTYGAVKGYPMNGTLAPSKTTFYGLYDRAASFDNKGPFELPARYQEGKAKLDLSTPFNFVSTCDIIGGNSGSPVINKAGEIVGLIFDGNIESLLGNMVYDDRANRAVAVHTAGMTEALLKLYDAEFLVRELTGK